MTKYEYKIEETPDERYLKLPFESQNRDPEYLKGKLINILSESGREGWIYSGTDPMGNMVFRRKVLDN